ncbi:IclR family transcriptional regulator [Caballeronia arvi]|uniref:IclR family transcriptional regulator n=1 Tax=Caballeronia arvi TaxID=1777135 RepID=A0A158KY24_9BURK|nr:helix-turn-helix domain-containing protein [Caballeronia arvi]SAL86014.1 IclR family transcriptional regulator [Caballeronia arvi]
MSTHCANNSERASVRAPETVAHSRGVQSLERAIVVLRLLAKHHVTGVSLASVVAKTGLDRTTAYRIASSLVESGMASRGPEKEYRLGIETMALGMTAMQRPPLIDRCAPMMKRLARQSGGHVLLCIQSGDYAHCLHMESAEPQMPEISSYLGMMRLLGIGISGVALLARQSDQYIREHYTRRRVEYHKHRMTENKLCGLLERTRSNDFAYVHPRQMAGVGISFETDSCGLAGLNVIARTSELPLSRAPAVASMMREHLVDLISKEGSSSATAR